MGHFDILIIGGGAAGIAAARAQRMPDAKALRWWRENKSWAAFSYNAAIPVLAPDLPEGNTPLRLCRISRKRLLCFLGQRCFR